MVEMPPSALPASYIQPPFQEHPWLSRQAQHTAVQEDRSQDPQGKLLMVPDLTGSLASGIPITNLCTRQASPCTADNEDRRGKSDAVPPSLSQMNAPIAQRGQRESGVGQQVLLQPGRVSTIKISFGEALRVWLYPAAQSQNPHT